MLGSALLRGFNSWFDPPSDRCFELNDLLHGNDLNFDDGENDDVDHDHDHGGANDSKDDDDDGDGDDDDGDDDDDDNGELNLRSYTFQRQGFTPNK